MERTIRRNAKGELVALNGQRVRRNAKGKLVDTGGLGWRLVHTERLPDGGIAETWERDETPEEIARHEKIAREARREAEGILAGTKAKLERLRQALPRLHKQAADEIERERQGHERKVRRAAERARQEGYAKGARTGYRRGATKGLAHGEDVTLRRMMGAVAEIRANPTTVLSEQERAERAAEL